MQRWHAGFDAGHLVPHEERLRTRIAAIEQEAAKLVGSSINLNSASQLSAALYDTLALPAPRNRSDRSAVCNGMLCCSMLPFGCTVDCPCASNRISVCAYACGKVNHMESVAMLWHCYLMLVTRQAKRKVHTMFREAWVSHEQ